MQHSINYVIKKLRKFVACMTGRAHITAGEWTMSGVIGELTGQPFFLPDMLTSHIRSYCLWKKLKFPCYSLISVVIGRLWVAMYCGTLIWNLGCNASKTVVYNSCIETDIIIWRHWTNLMCTVMIFNALWVNLTDSAQAYIHFTAIIYFYCW